MTVYNELVKSVNAIQTTDTNNVVIKADHDMKIDEIEKKKKNPTMINILLHKNLRS